MISGDSHNFGKRVLLSPDDPNLLLKPRTVFWEWLFFGKTSPLFRSVSTRLGFSHLVPGLEFLGDVGDPWSGKAALFKGSECPDIAFSMDLKKSLGALIAYCQFFGIGDLHKENILYAGQSNLNFQIQPVDIECVLARMKMPSETHLVPNHSYKNFDISGFHDIFCLKSFAANGESLVNIAQGYSASCKALISNYSTYSELIRLAVTGKKVPIRVILRETKAYRRHLDGVIDISQLAPESPLESSEREQLARQDIPYFYRYFGSEELFYCHDNDHQEKNALISRNLLTEAFPPLLEEDFGILQIDESMSAFGIGQILNSIRYPSRHFIDIDGWKVWFAEEEVKCILPDGSKFKFVFAR